MMKLLTVFSIFIFLLCSSKAMCCLALRGKEFNAQASQKESYYSGTEVQFDTSMVQGRESFSSKDMAKIIPLNLKAQSGQNQVASEILKKTTRSLQHSEMIKNSFIGKTMDDLKASPKTLLGHIKKTLFSEQDLLSSESDQEKGSKVKNTKTLSKKQSFDARDAMATDHRFKLKLRANNQEARVVYQGFVDSQIRYSGKDEAFNVSIQEKLSDNSKIALIHQTDGRGSQQTLNFKVNW